MEFKKSRVEKTEKQEYKMTEEDKIDLILQKVSIIEIRTAVQDQRLDTHSSYFKWIAGGGLLSLLSAVCSAIIFIILL